MRTARGSFAAVGLTDIKESQIKQMRWFLIAAITSASLVSGDTLMAQPSDPIIGVWALNLSKSTFDPAFPAARSQTRTYEDRGGGLVVATYEGVDAQGQPTFNQYAYKRDGKEYPELVRGSRTAASISFRAIDDYTTELVIKQDGVVSTTGIVAVSFDGKTMTNSTKGSSRDGKPIVNVTVYDRRQ